MGLFALLYTKGGDLNKGSLPEFTSGLYAGSKDYGNAEGQVCLQRSTRGRHIVASALLKSVRLCCVVENVYLKNVVQKC